MDHRSDIDGLRGAAVLAVVGYHAFPHWFPAGFMGVDLFFVVSGFLITRIISDGLADGRFSFGDFYSRRIRRLFPALLLVLVACLVGGWMLLLADEYKQLGKHTVGGAGFVANIMLWREGGYFDSAAETKLLLHLWSLGVEEQFYIAWPCLLWLLFRGRLNTPWMTLLIASLSFGLALAMLRSDETGAFYAPQARVWQLLVGAALAQWQGQRSNAPSNAAVWLPDLQSALGLALLGAAMLLVDADKAYPGWWALLPTLGSALLIAGGQRAWLNRRVLAQRWLVWVGLISYPLYLWHWPLLTMARIVETDMPGRGVRVLLVALSVLLAWLTYRLVERPVRMGRHGGAKAITLAGLMVLTAVAGLECYRRNGFDGFGLRSEGTQAFANHFENSLPAWRFYERTQAFKHSRAECNFYDLARFRAGRATRVPVDSIDDSCHVRDARKPLAVLVWGDSHAQQLFYGLNRSLPAQWQILQVASSDCAPDPSVRSDSDSDHCQRSNWFALQTVRSARPDVVVVAQNLGHDVATMRQIASRLQADGVRRIVFTGPTPHWTSNLPTLILRKLWHNTPERSFVGIDQRVLDANTALQREFTPSDNVRLVDLIATFCNPQGCLTRIGPDRMHGITSHDYGHLSPVASEHLARHALAEAISGGAMAPRSAGSAAADQRPPD